MITRIKAIIDSMGLPFRYGNPSQINYYLQNVDYAAAPDGVAAYCYLLTDSEYINGKERATIAVFFSKLMPFDFNGSEAVSVTDDCKAKAKEFLHQVAIGNSLTYHDARFQYGYNDFAENVAWCAVRANFEMMVPDCVTMVQLPTRVLPLLIGGLTPTTLDVVILTDTVSEWPLTVLWDFMSCNFDIRNTAILDTANPPFWYNPTIMSDYVGGRYYEITLKDISTFGHHFLQVVVGSVQSAIIPVNL